jgi:hypothetical protein
LPDKSTIQAVQLFLLIKTIKTGLSMAFYWVNLGEMWFEETEKKREN